MALFLQNVQRGNEAMTPKKTEVREFDHLNVRDNSFKLLVFTWKKTLCFLNPNVLILVSVNIKLVNEQNLNTESKL